MTKREIKKKYKIKYICFIDTGKIIDLDENDYTCQSSDQVSYPPSFLQQFNSKANNQPIQINIPPFVPQSSASSDTYHHSTDFLDSNSKNIQTRKYVHYTLPQITMKTPKDKNPCSFESLFYEASINDDCDEFEKYFFDDDNPNI